MWKTMKAIGPLGVGLLAWTLGLSPPACGEDRPVAASVRPKAYGTQDYSITVLSALSFRPTCYSELDRMTLSRYCCNQEYCSDGTHFYAGLDLPAGAVIDYIGVNTATTVGGAMGFTLHFRDHLGGSAQLASATLPTHAGGGFLTDYAGPLGIVIPDNHDREFLLDVEVAPGLEAQYFGFVEIWWRRSVSNPPASPTFADVPNGHPFYQFVEALGASGITGGCGSGNYCPEAPLTRGQMAVFLSKALGLHWPE